MPVLAVLLVAIAGFAPFAYPAAATTSTITTPSDQRPNMKPDYSFWEQLLTRYVKTDRSGVNLFAYNKVSPADKKALKVLLATLQKTSVSNLSRDDQMAFWINLYNAQTIDIVLDHYPVKSIKDISLGGGFFSSGPWKKLLMTVEGRSLSLDNVEHDILRKQWRDPRIHYAVNCASISCPNLAAKAYTSDKLEEMLTEQAKHYINHERGVSVKDGRLRLSQIYSWYRSDFGRSDADIIKHIATYASPELKKNIAGIKSISGYDYDWSLNEAK